MKRAFCPHVLRSIWSALVAVALLCSVELGSANAEPPMPEGYSTEQAVMEAIGAGKVRMISPPLTMPDGVVEKKDIEYGKAGARSLLLDMYSPAKAGKPVPGLIFIHGGGWKSGKRSDYLKYVVDFAQKGYVAATISYRMTDEALSPACVEDAKCAVRWMRSQASEIHVDPNKIAVIGGSAGGHLSMMVGYSSDVSQLEGNGGHNDVSSRVQAVVDFYGPVDLTVPAARVHEVVTKFIGKPYEEAKEAYALVSPLQHVTKDDPPTLIFHGTIDSLVPVAHADWLTAKLTEVGVPVECKKLVGWPHTMDLAAPVNEYCQYHMQQFFEKYLPLPK